MPPGVELTRRSWVLALAASLRAAGPEIVVAVADSADHEAPSPFAGQALRFSRAYAACPSVAGAQQSIAWGRFPHTGAGAGYGAIPIISVEELKARGALSNEQIVVFTACRGLDQREEPGEGCVRIPLIIRCPRLFPAARTEDFLVSTVDLAPTLLGLTGAEIPAGMQGRNLSPLLLSGGSPRPESIFCEGKIGSTSEWRMLVRGLDKIVVNRGFGVSHLFNLGQDPLETANLAGNPNFDLKRNELKALMREWLRRTEDRMDSSGLKRRDR